jgi:transmembrane sensor
MSNRRPREPSVDEQAARFVRELPNGSPQTRQGLAQWLRRSPEHVGAFLRHRMLGVELKGLDPDRSIDVDGFIARAKSTSTVVEWPGPTAEVAVAPLPVSPAGGSVDREAGGGSDRASRRRMLIAAGIIGALALFWGGARWAGHWFQREPVIYRTGIGQQRQLHLPDGSMLELNTQSAVQVQFSPTFRDVYLLGGEALFDVHHNAAVPFRVHVGATVIQDVGTQFSVRRAEGLTTVSVLEGSVQVSADHSSPATPVTGGSALAPTVVVASRDYQRLTPDTTLAAGEQMHIVADGTLIQRQRVDVGQATAWRQGRLVFSEATLEEIVSEFNRYNVRQIILVGDAHRTRRYSGVFDAADPQSFLEYLRRDDGGLAVENDADGLVIRGPSERNQATTR